jgi:hypothetical protein
LTRATIGRNRAESGGGLAATAAQIEIANARIAWNAASARGGGVLADDTYLSIANSVVADNGAAAGSALAGGGTYGVFADFDEAVIFRNRGASTVEVSAGSEIGAAYTCLFANEGALGAIVRDDSAAANLFDDPRVVGSTWERLDYLPGLGSPLIDAGREWPAAADLDSTRRDIGVGGGPSSGWIAPRPPSFFGAHTHDDFVVHVSGGGTGGDSGVPPYTVGIYRGVGEPPEIRDESLIARDERFDHYDSAAVFVGLDLYYQAVTVDALGRAGPASSSVVIRPQNDPPRVWTGVTAYRASTATTQIDSLEMRIEATDDAVEVRVAIETGAGRQELSEADLPFLVRFPIEEVAGRPFTVIGRGSDRFGAVGEDTLRAYLQHLIPGVRDSGTDSSGTLHFRAPALTAEALFNVESRPVPDSLPREQVPLSRVFDLNEISAWWLPRPPTLEIAIDGPPEILEDESIILCCDFDVVFAGFRVTHDVATHRRSANISSNYYWRPLALAAKTPTSDVPKELRMSLVGPNPFRDRTEFRVDLARPAEVDFGVYDASGRRVRVLQSGALPAGFFTISWDGRDAGGRRAASGHYFVAGSANGALVKRRVTLIR